MFSDTLPILVRVDLLALFHVPEQDDDRGYDCDDGAQTLIVPFHVVEEEADPLTSTWSIVTTV